jgi:hypothetical protein
MHAHELAHLAALAAVHSEQLIAADAATMDRMLSAYWKASRCRLDRWGHGLSLITKRDKQSASTDFEIGAVRETVVQETIEEILVSDLVTRVVTAIAIAHDARLHANESAPVARNIFSAHVDLRQRAVALVLAPHRDQEQARDVLALRRQCERWTDLLLAYLTPHFAANHVAANHDAANQFAIDEFAADPARVGDFAFDAREHLRSGSSSDMAITMITAGMRSSLGPLQTNRTLNTDLNGDLNRDIATAILSGFAPDFFDTHGHLRSPWLERLQRVPNESPLDRENLRQISPHARHEVPRPARWRW